MLSLQSILEATAEFFKIDPDQIRSRDRHKSIAHARKVFFYIARKKTGMSFDRIGAFLGRDHTTVMCSFDSVSRFSEGEGETYLQINSILSSLDPYPFEMGNTAWV
jgi:chromosomal replication initiation ATPase DnaA